MRSRVGGDYTWRIARHLLRSGIRQVARLRHPFPDGSGEPSPELFASGVASGDPTTSSVVLWTRARPAGGTDVELEWSIGPVGDDHRRSGTVAATSERDHTVHVEVHGLDPGTEYEYAFRSGDAEVAGRTRTLPERSDRLRMVVACCSRWGWPGFDRFDAIVAEQPDVMLHLGDSIYEVGELPPDRTWTDPPWDCVSLDDYRRRYSQHRSHPALRRLHASVPMLAMWDDHEVADNSPDPDDRARRSAGQRAWAEWLPVRPADRPAPLDRSVRIDGLLDLALLDARFAGRTPADTDGPTTGRARGRIVGDDQWRRLDDLAAESWAPWFVIANQVQVGPMILAARPTLAWPPWKPLVNPDQWDGYPEDRERLYAVLRRAAGRAVVLSGDLHSGWSRTLIERGAHGQQVGHEFTAPSISGHTYARAVQRRLPIPSGLLDAWLRRLNPGIDHLDLTRHGFLVCDVTLDEFVTTFVTHDGERTTRTLRRG